MSIATRAALWAATSLLCLTSCLKAGPDPPTDGVDLSGPAADLRAEGQDLSPPSGDLAAPCRPALRRLSRPLQFAAPRDISPEIDLHGLTVGDFNGDCKLDLAGGLYTGTGGVHVLLGGGDGSFRAQASAATGKSPFSLAAADLNGDGRDDLAVSNNAASSVSVLLSQGDGSFRAPASPYPVQGTPQDIAVGDVDENGVPDLVLITGDAGYSVLLGQGAGAFSMASYSPGVGGNGGLVLRDRDGDGHLDLLLGHFPGGKSRLYSLRGGGKGTFAETWSGDLTGGSHSIAAADFDEDGRLDLAVSDRDPGTLTILRGKADGSFEALGAWPTGTRPRGVAAADLDGDGHADVIVGHDQSDFVRVLLGQGNGALKAQAMDLPFAPGNWFAVGDFDRDGRLDLALASQNRSPVRILLNTTP